MKKYVILSIVAMTVMAATITMLNANNDEVLGISTPVSITVSNPSIIPTSAAPLQALANAATNVANAAQTLANVANAAQQFTNAIQTGGQRSAYQSDQEALMSNLD